MAFVPGACWWMYWDKSLEKLIRGRGRLRSSEGAAVDSCSLARSSRWTGLEERSARSRGSGTVRLQLSWREQTRYGMTRQDEDESETDQQIRAIQGLLRAGYLDQAFKRYRHLHETNRLSTRQYNRCMRLLGEFDNLSTAWMVYSDLLGEESRAEADLSTFNTAIQLCAVRRDSARLKVAYRDLQRQRASFKPNRETYRAVVNTLSFVGDIEDAEEAVKDMEAQEMKPDLPVLRSLMRMYANNRQYSGVIACYRRMKLLRIRPDRASYNMYINALTITRSDDALNEAEETFRKMNSPSRSSGPPPDVSTFNALIKNHAARNELRRAKEYYQMMIQKKVHPNELTFSILLSAMRRAGDERNARNAFAEMQRRRVQVNVEHYQHMLMLLLNRHEHSRAEEMYIEMRRLGLRPNVQVYNVMLTIYVREQREAEALALFDDMRVQHVRADAHTYALLQRLALELRGAPHCREWFDRLTADNITPVETNYALLIDTLLREGSVDEAAEVVRTAQQSGVRERARLTLAYIRVAAASGDRRIARELTRKLLENRTTWRVERLQLDLLTEAVARMGERKLALKLRDELLADGWRLTSGTCAALNELLVSEHQERDTTDSAAQTKGDAEDMFARAMTNTDLKAPTSDDVHYFVRLIERFGRRGDALRAERALRLMLNERLRPSLDVYNAYIRACAIAKELPRAQAALRALLNIDDPLLSPNDGSFRPLILALLKARQLDAARRLLELAAQRGVRLSLSQTQQEKHDAGREEESASDKVAEVKEADGDYDRHSDVSHSNDMALYGRWTPSASREGFDVREEGVPSAFERLSFSVDEDSFRRQDGNGAENGREERGAVFEEVLEDDQRSKGNESREEHWEDADDDVERSGWLEKDDADVGVNGVETEPRQERLARKRSMRDGDEVEDDWDDILSFVELQKSDMSNNVASNSTMNGNVKATGEAILDTTLSANKIEPKVE